jgi:hypothetical protein
MTVMVLPSCRWAVAKKQTNGNVFSIIAGLFKIVQHTYTKPICALHPTRWDIQHVVSVIGLTHNWAFGILGCVKSNFWFFRWLRFIRHRKCCDMYLELHHN